MVGSFFIYPSAQPVVDGAANISAEVWMAWPDPATMSDSEIETELGELVAKLGEVRGAGER